MIKKPWTDGKGNCKCESCGRITKNLKWERGLGYCSSCYAEIKQYNENKKKT